MSKWGFCHGNTPTPTFLHPSLTPKDATGSVTLLPAWQGMLHALGCIQALADQQGSNLG